MALGVTDYQDGFEGDLPNVNQFPKLSSPLVDIQSEAIDQDEIDAGSRIIPFRGVENLLFLKERNFIFEAKNKPWECLLKVTRLTIIQIAMISDQQLLNILNIELSNIPFPLSIVEGFSKVEELRAALTLTLNSES